MTPRPSNPLLNDRRLKLGTFSTNVKGGGSMSTMDGLLEVTWPNTLAIAKLADEMDFEAIVPVGRWKGFGGPSDFNGESFEVFSWAAGITASTASSSVFATVHIPTMHPLFAANQATTIDHIGGGRFALNLVTGWFTPEMEMFGITLLEHDKRYAMADEWIQIVARLWDDPEPFDFNGQYYQLKKAELRPKPIQRPRPPLMSAAGSEVGRRFAAKHCDICFVINDSHEPEMMKAKVDKYRNFAREEFGRDIQVWTNAYIFHGDTDADAQALWNHCVIEKGDEETLKNYLDVIGMNSQQLPLEAYEFLKKHFHAGWCGYPMIGQKETIVERLATLERVGFDGVVITWPRWVEGLTRFRDEVLPLLKQAGLR